MGINMDDDYLDNLFSKFIQERQSSVQGLFTKYKGIFRAQVVETNDPLNMRRVRIRVPEMHDLSLEPKKLPWAIVSNLSGGKQCGSFHNYAIGDIVMVFFERNHPYSPIVIASGDETRRARYPLDSVYNVSPTALTEMAETDETPSDYEFNWLPKDKRPMSQGMKDRYGNCFIMNSVGFFPKEHAGQPGAAGYNAVSEKEYEKGDKPKDNDPDTKYMAMYSKYGNFLIMSDIGYDWKKEFDGDWDEDKEKERERVKYYTKHFTELKSNNRDQRRIEMRTRCGHFFEMRDVGWKTARKSDPWVEGELNTGSDSGYDERWFKLRSKGGHLIQIMDSGFDEKEDNLYKTLNSDQYGGLVDNEENFWQNQDARQIRFITRHGFKFILDDRGSDETKAEEDDTPHGNGLLIKGKRRWGEKLRGFGIEFNEKDEMNKLSIYTPKSKVFEMNDKFNYIMLCTDTRTLISEEWQYKKDNAFARNHVRKFSPEQDTYHLLLDNNNEYLRLKSPSQAGIEVRDGGLNPGFSCDDNPEEGSGGAPRDNEAGQRYFNTGNRCELKTWVEVTDKDKRAFFMTHDEEALVMHSCECCPTNCNSPIPAMWLVFDEKGEGSGAGIWTKHTEPNTIIMQNLCNKIKVYAVNDIEFYTLKNFRIKAHENVEIRALQDIIWRADRDIKGSSDRITHHWSGDDYKIKSKKDYQLQALKRITNKAGTNHCIEALSQASSKSNGQPNVMEGPGAKWVVGPGAVGTQSTIKAPMIIAKVGPGPQAKVLSGSSAGVWPVGTSSGLNGSACSAVDVQHGVRIQESDNEYQRPDENRFITCGRKEAGNGPFPIVPLNVIRGKQGPPGGGTTPPGYGNNSSGPGAGPGGPGTGPGGSNPGGINPEVPDTGAPVPAAPVTPVTPGPGNPEIPNYDGGSPVNPEPPPPSPDPAPPPPPPDPGGTIGCFQAVGFAVRTGNLDDWATARANCDEAPITAGNYGGLQSADIITVIRGGCSLSAAGLNSLQLEITTKKTSSDHLTFNIIYSYCVPVIGEDFNSWYSIGEVNTKEEVWNLNANSIINAAAGGYIYFAAVAKSDRFNSEWPKIYPNRNDEWTCVPTFKFIINENPVNGVLL
jgi:hypothetical protein